MIHVTQESTQFKGTKLELSVEVTQLIRHCFNEHVFTKDEVLQFVELASKTDDELKAENDKLTEELNERIDNMDMPEELKDVLKEFGGLL